MKKLLLITSYLLLTTLAFSASKSKAIVTNLSERKQSIVLVSALAAKGDWNSLKTEIDIALERGLTVNDLGEIFLQLYAYAGFPKSLTAQSVLQNVVNEREAANKNVIYGTTPDSVPSENRYDIGRDTINRLFARNGTQGRPTTTGYAETTDIFLKEHLFSDIIGRNNMGAEERELATVSMLAAIMTVNTQFKSHTNGALQNGNTPEELEAAWKLFAKKVGKAESKNALAILNEVVTANAASQGSANPQSTKTEAPYPSAVRVFSVPRRHTEYSHRAIF